MNTAKDGGAAGKVRGDDGITRRRWEGCGDIQQEDEEQDRWGSDW